ncbi:hypothetical protein THII_0042 [Thioploca ingrica]|uniref:Uncharacterized protein n=1 Tax=Thioploca ingrica TaxID=40754 RepID=A0A090ACD1_9GAMM|nr:hypothetical protein THII_0042 [Thioploca ingrica]
MGGPDGGKWHTCETDKNDADASFNRFIRGKVIDLCKNQARLAGCIPAIPICGDTGECKVDDNQEFGDDEKLVYIIGVDEPNNQDCDDSAEKEFIYDYLFPLSLTCSCTCQPRTSPLLHVEKCNEPKSGFIEPNKSSGSIQVENLMDGGCQSLIISQPTLSTGDSNAISLPSGNSLKSISLAPPYDSSNIQISEAGAIINLAPLFGRGKTMNINFELNSPAEANTVIAASCQCPLDVKVASFNAALEADKKEVALTWEILEGNNAYLNIWGAQLEANEFKNVTQLNSKPIPIDETAPLMNFSLETNQLQPGVTYFALESVDYNGECVTYCDDIDAVVLGPVTVDLESVKNLCNQEMKRQIAVFGNTGSCVK